MSKGLELLFREERKGSQAIIHVFECVLRLVEEAVHDSVTEVSVVLVIVHLEYLLEGGGVDVFARGV